MIARRIEAWAREAPDAVAVVAEDGALTYRQLNAQANRLARVLLALGAGPERIVGIALERNAALPVALLAVHKAGGAYLPLDPSYPSARLRYMLGDAQPLVVVTAAASAEALPFDAPLCLDDPAIWARIAAASEADLADAERNEPLDPEHAAYLIYTSGTTGLPRGVVVPRGALHHHVQAMQQRFPLEPHDRMLARTPISFDAAQWELWLALCCGAALHLAPAALSHDPTQFVRYLADAEITATQFVPSLLAVTLAQAERDTAHAPRLTRIFCGGEALPASVAAQAATRWGPARVVNLYGPTETTIQVAAWERTPDDVGDTVPLGRALAGSTLHVLDERLDPVPPGKAGELYIGGAQLARGYLNQPALTAERFVPDPYGAPGGRLYRSGDLVRRRADGVLEFLGRLDDQIKLRGFRIELGEIESVLQTHPAIAQAAAIVREERHGDRRLTAYVVFDREHPMPPDARELRAYVSERVPEYMVPSAVVPVTRLPLTANGKLDRAALSAL